MSELTLEQETFRGAPNPYGYPFIVFPSINGDSTIFMIQGHHPPTRRLIATYSWIKKTFGIEFYIDRPYVTLMEAGWAKFTQINQDDFHIEILEEPEEGAFSVTFIEV